LVWGFKGREEERGGVVRCEVSNGEDHAERVTRSEEGDKDKHIPFRWRKKKWTGLGLRKKENGPRKRGRFWKIFKTYF
jgi:hypothetical protein